MRDRRTRSSFGVQSVEADASPRAEFVVPRDGARVAEVAFTEVRRPRGVQRAGHGQARAAPHTTVVRPVNVPRVARVALAGAGQQPRVDGACDLTRGRKVSRGDVCKAHLGAAAAPRLGARVPVDGAAVTRLMADSYMRNDGVRGLPGKSSWGRRARLAGS